MAEQTLVRHRATLTDPIPANSGPGPAAIVALDHWSMRPRHGYATAYRLTGPDLASDAIQQAYVRACPPASAATRRSPWLYRIVERVLGRALPTPYVHISGEEQTHPRWSTGDPRAEVERRDDRRSQSLPHLRRPPYRARLDLNGLSYEQIADVLARPGTEP
jgi:DNA-directed RNA polymerase specialized sigma24 family protein